MEQFTIGVNTTLKTHPIALCFPPNVYQNNETEQTNALSQYFNPLAFSQLLLQGQQPLPKGFQRLLRHKLFGVSSVQSLCSTSDD